MDLSGQERDAILTGLSLLRQAIEGGLANKNPVDDGIADLFTNGGEHRGLSSKGITRLADLILYEYPAPALGADHEDELQADRSLPPQISQVGVSHWSEYQEGRKPQSDSSAFVMEVTDRRSEEGKAEIVLAAREGEVDDVMSVAMEVASEPSSGAATQATLVHIGEALLLTLFKVRDELILLPSSGEIGLSKVRMPNGESAWSIS